MLNYSNKWFSNLLKISPALPSRYMSVMDWVNREASGLISIINAPLLFAECGT